MVDLASRLAGHATATALIDQGERISYAELSDRVLRTAAALRARDSADGQVIGVMASPSIDGVVAYLGVQAAGLVPAMLSPRGPQGELQRRIEEVNASSVLIGSEKFNIPTGVSSARPAGSSATDVEVLDGDPGEPAPVKADDVAVVLYTSGVSGLPKPIALTYGNLASTRDGLIASPGSGLNSTTVALASLPLAHVFGLNSIVGTVLRAGGKLVLNDGFDPAVVSELVARHRVTAVSGVPLMWKALAATGLRDHFETVTRATYAAAPMTPGILAAVEEHLGLRVAGGFGLTETSGTVCHDDPTAPVPGSVGRPLGSTQLRVIDTDGEDVLIGDFGEIWLRGPSLASSYLDGSPLATSDDGWFRTGDIGVIGDDGRLAIVDRQKDVINVSGFNVSPIEVENVLSTHPGVTTSVVVGEAEDDSEVVIAHVVPTPGVVVDEAILIEHCRDQLSRYKVPRRVFLHDELPLTESGKAIRRLVGRD